MKLDTVLAKRENKVVYKPSDAMQGSIGMKQHKYYDEVYQ